VKGTLSLVSPSARPKNRRKSAAYAAYDFVGSNVIDPKMKLARWDQISPKSNIWALRQNQPNSKLKIDVGTGLAGLKNNFE
jgi:hypothetical protein